MSYVDALTIEQVHDLFGCTYTSLAFNYAQGAQTMRLIEEAARRSPTGKSRNYTAAEAARLAEDQEARAAACYAKGDMV